MPPPVRPSPPLPRYLRPGRGQAPAWEQFKDNPWRGFIEEQPRGTYFSYLNQMGGNSPNQRRFYQNAFSDIHDQYLGYLMSQVRAGTEPAQQSKFSNFLTDWDFKSYYQDLPPSLRGESASPYAPPVRWML